jgi:hypothetical protein
MYHLLTECYFSIMYEFEKWSSDSSNGHSICAKNLLHYLQHIIECIQYYLQNRVYFYELNLQI